MNRSVILVALALCSRAVAGEVQFDDLRANFEQYNGREVTVKGILEVAGNDNYLYRDSEGRKQQRIWIHVLPDLNRPDAPGGFAPDAPANLHWVKITGMVDVSFHGHFGKEPFGLRQTKIEMLPGPRLKHFLSTLAWFKNETPQEVEIEIDATPWSESFSAKPGEVVCAENMQKGVNKVSVKAKDGKALTQLKVENVQTSRFYDRRKHAYYFRITDEKITPVIPSQAQNWKFAPTPERD